jgi:DNA-binding response OmpR family regulator
LNKKVLIIENDELLKDIVTFILEADGYEVVVARYAPEDLQEIHADLILLDEWINVKEGHMLCKQIKQITSLANVPIIIFSTAYNIIEIVKTCGADGYVLKPFDLDILLTEIKRFRPLSMAPVSPEAAG